MTGSAKSGDDRKARMPLPDFTAFNPGYKDAKEKEAERRETDRSVLRAADKFTRTCANHLLRARQRSSGSARLSAFHHGACGSERTPPLSSSPRFLGRPLGSGRYPPPAGLSAAKLLAGRS